MEYMTTAQAAKLWGITIRQVQRLLRDQRIEGARLFGSAWIIPEDAEKPTRRGTRAAAAESAPTRQATADAAAPTRQIAADVAAPTRQTAADADRPEPTRQAAAAADRLEPDCLDWGGWVSMVIPMPHDDPAKVLDTLPPAIRSGYESDLCYCKGDFDAVKRLYREASCGEEAIPPAWSSIIGTAIGTGDYALFREVEMSLKRRLEAEPAERKVLLEALLSIGPVSAYSPELAPRWLKTGDIDVLPQQARLLGVYLRAKYLQVTGSYREMLSVLQTAIAFFPGQGGFTMADIYIRILCACAEVALGHQDRAQEWLLAAMRFGLPQGFITPFAESMMNLGGLMESCLTRYYPEMHDEVTRQHEFLLKHWIGFHNAFEQDHITLCLTTSEYRVAALASAGETNAEIAQRLGCSISNVKKILSSVFAKLFITRREQLKEYIL